MLVFSAMVFSLLGFAGGGGSSSSSGGGGGSSGGGSSSWSSSSDGGGEFTWEGFLGSLLVLAIVVPPVVLVEVWSSKRAARKIKQAYNEKISKLNARDHNDTEQEKWIHKEAERIFVQYQQDWSDYNLKKIQEYTTDEYYQHACLMLEAIDCMNRRNVVSDLSVTRTYLLSPMGEGWDLPATTQVMFRFGGTDSIVDTKSGRKIHSDKARGVEEYWDFVYDGKTLKLDGITQSTESTPHLIDSIKNFAEEHRLFYSPDWGRLALPTKGLIFDRWGLSSADVNNHVIGRWKDCLVQMYTYSATPAQPNSYYLVGQISLPKSYDGVIIESKKAKLKVVKPEKYERFKLEWEDFNKRYAVYAAKKDALPAFELLNPAFMNKLYERNLPYNLEVRDNTIYIFAKAKETKENDYRELFDVLSEAFEELRM